MIVALTVSGSGCVEAPSPVVSEIDRTGVRPIEPANDDDPLCRPHSQDILAWWPMDGDGTELIAGRDATTTGSGGFAQGHVGDAYAPEVYSPAVATSDPALYETEMTLSTWVRLDGYNFRIMPVLWSGGPLAADVTSSYAIGIEGTRFRPGRVYFIVGDGERRDIVYSSQQLPLGGFVHLVATFDGQVLKLYWNGALEAQIPQTVESYESPYPIQIGAIDNEGLTDKQYWVDGIIDEVMLFDRALTPSEVADIFEAGAAGLCKSAYLDGDADGVLDSDDLCRATAVPEANVPTRGLKPNHFALIDADTEFDTIEVGRGKGPARSYSLEDTRGCSCEQIIEARGLGEGHRRYGCSIGVMDNWVRDVKEGP